MVAILTITAHNDDQIVGPGGALIKYAKQGKKFKTIIFSYGESSHLHLKPEVIADIRKKEALKSDKIMGGSGIEILGITEGTFNESFDMKMEKRLMGMIRSEKPEKIFTHSKDDPHPDHRAVNAIVRRVLKKMNYSGDLYIFNVWNPISIRQRNKPKLVIDITDTFATKVKAFDAHKSQKLARWSLMWNVYLDAILKGLEYGHKYAEVFLKVK